MPRVDVEASNAAIEKHEDGIDYLNELFRATPARIWMVGWDRQTGKPIPFRRKAGVPNMRPDAKANARRAKRKRAHESRRRNR